MVRTLTLHVAGFAAGSLDRMVGDGDSSPDGIFRTAALYYLGDEEAGRPSWRAPRLEPAAARGEGLSISFDDETLAALEREARRQDVTPEQLALHALMYYLSDLESGRAGERLAEALDEGQGRGADKER
jgi:hypothetical protein